jgi:hypothetical protein
VGHVLALAHHEVVGAVEADMVGRDLCLAAHALIEQQGNAAAPCAPGKEEATDIK